MKTIAVLAVVGIAVAAFFAYNSTPNNEVEEAFRGFIEEYRVGYGNSDEYSYRLGVFQENLKRYEELNILNPEAVFGITQFSDRTPAEMEAYMGYSASAEREYTDIHTFDPSQVVGAFDWSSKLSGVKNQGSCGSCWAFSAIGALEPRYHLTTKKKDRVDVTFSEQQLVDCDTRSSGCNGGLMTYAFMYLQSAKFMKESDYAYTARKGTCRADAGKGVDVVKGYKSASGSHNALISAGQDGPVSVAVDASNWSGYRGGVFSNCGTRLNHGVTFVGYDGSAYKIRNSWGSGWGENGYIRLAQGNTVFDFV